MNSPQYRRRKSRRYCRAADPSKPVADKPLVSPPVPAASATALPPDPAPPPPADPAPDIGDLTRKEIMLQLDELGAKYNKRATRRELGAQLWTALMVAG